MTGRVRDSRGRQHPIARLSVTLALVLIAASGCGDGGRPAGDANRGAVAVGMDEYRFSPEDAAIRRGRTLLVENRGEIAHNLVIERGPDPREKSARLAGTSTFLPGKTERLEVRLSPGRYAMVCTVVGHRQLGMVGSLSVRP